MRELIRSRITDHELVRLLVRSVAPALPTELLELEPVVSLLLVLCRNVVAALALSALQRDVVSWHNPSILLNNLRNGPRSYRPATFSYRKRQPLLHRDR